MSGAPGRRAVHAAEAVLVAVSLAAYTHAAWAPNALGHRVRTLVSQLGWRSAEMLESVPLLAEAEEAFVWGNAALLTGLFAGPLFLLRPGRGGRGSAAARVWAELGALPACLGLLSVLTYATGLAPGGLLVGLSVLLVMEGLRARAGNAAGRAGVFDAPTPLPAGRAVFLAALFVGLLSFLTLHALYVSGPGIQPTLVADEGLTGWLQDRLPAPPPWLDPQLPGALVSGLVAWLVGSGGRSAVPRLASAPSGWLRSFLWLALIAGAGALPVQLLDVWACPEPDSGTTRLLSDDRGVFQTHVVGRQLWAVDREGRRTLRFSLPDGDALPEIRWDSRVPEAWPEEQMPLPDGRVWTALVAPDLLDSSVIAIVDAETGERAAEPLVTPGCYVASWAWLSRRQRLLIGCEYTPELLVVDPQTRRIEQRFEVPEAGSFEEIVLAEDERSLLAFPLWTGTDVVRVDLETRQAVRRGFLGDFNWGAVRDPALPLVHVARFQEGQVWSLDSATFERRRSLRVGYGARPVTLTPDGGWMLVAGTYSGRLDAWSTDGDQHRTLRVGGLVRSLAIDPADGALFFGGRCGIRRVDLGAWLR